MFYSCFFNQETSLGPHIASATWTTCAAGIWRMYYYLAVSRRVSFEEQGGDGPVTSKTRLQNSLGILGCLGKMMGTWWFTKWFLGVLKNLLEIVHDKPWGPMGAHWASIVSWSTGRTDWWQTVVLPGRPRISRDAPARSSYTNHLDMSGSRQLESGLCAVHTDPRCDWTTWKLLEMLKDVQSSTFRWLEGSFSGQFCRHLPDFYVFFLAAMCGWNVSSSSSNVRICCVLQPPNIKTIKMFIVPSFKMFTGVPHKIKQWFTGWDIYIFLLHSFEMFRMHPGV